MKDKIINGFKKHGREIGFIAAGTAIAIGVAVWTMKRSGPEVDSEPWMTWEIVGVDEEKDADLEQEETS